MKFSHATIYVASTYASREGSARQVQAALRARGYTTTSRWIDGAEEGQTQREAAIMDLQDVDRADVLLLLTLPKGTLFSGGGRCVEMGYALGRGKLVCVVGPRENVFCHHPLVRMFPDLNAFMDYMEEKDSDAG